MLISLSLATKSKTYIQGRYLVNFLLKSECVAIKWQRVTRRVTSPAERGSNLKFKKKSTLLSEHQLCSQVAWSAALSRPLSPSLKGEGCTAAAATKSLQSCSTLCNTTDGSPPGSPSLGFSRQEHWSGLPFPSPMHESEK